MIKVIVNGAAGRMGSLAVKTIENDAECELVGQLEHDDDLSAAIKSTDADVVVDFTTAEVVFDNAMAIVNAGARPVMGTSGLTPEQLEALQQLCTAKQLGGIVVPNFSLGAVLMMKYAQDAAKYLPHVEIIEMHHDAKQDSPSGTALKTAAMIAESRKETIDVKVGRETVKGARGAAVNDIAVHAVRLPGLVAHQQVIFGAVGETLTLRHDSINRDCFMPGVLLACKKVMALDNLVYGLESVL